jgi:hypothetical protein
MKTILIAAFIITIISNISIASEEDIFPSSFEITITSKETEKTGKIEASYSFDQDNRLKSLLVTYNGTDVSIPDEAIKAHPQMMLTSGRISGEAGYSALPWIYISFRISDSDPSRFYFAFQDGKFVKTFTHPKSTKDDTPSTKEDVASIDELILPSVVKKVGLEEPKFGSLGTKTPIEYRGNTYWVATFSPGEGVPLTFVAVYAPWNDSEYHRCFYAVSWRAGNLKATINPDSGMLELREDANSTLKGQVILSCNLNSVGTQASVDVKQPNRAEQGAVEPRGRSAKTKTPRPDTAELAKAIALTTVTLQGTVDSPGDYKLVKMEQTWVRGKYAWESTYKLRKLVPENPSAELIGMGGEVFITANLETGQTEVRYGE